MATTIKCPDCGHTEPSADGEPETCPECEGTMTAPSKKKSQAKSAALEDQERPKKKAKARDEDDQPAKKSKAAANETAARGDDKPRRGRNPRNGAAAKRAGLPSGFDDAELVAQVEEELEAGEVLHYACRPARKLAQLQAAAYAATAALLVLVPGVFAVSGLRDAKDSKDYLFALVALAVSIGAAAWGVLSARGRMRQASRGWYAVTDRRAIVFEIPLFGGAGEATIYTPDQLRKMWVRKSFWLKGGGDVVFKTKVTITTEVSERSEKTSKSITHYGFIGVEDVDAVRDVIEWVLLSDEDDADDE